MIKKTKSSWGLSACFLILPALLLAAAPVDPLVGSWLKDGEPAAELRSDHTGAIEGEEIRWSAEAGVLSFTYPSGEKEKLPYTVSGNVLSVESNGKAESFTRSAAKAAPKKGGKDRTSSLLLSTAWCTLEGSDPREKLIFKADGTWNTGGKDARPAGRWKVSGSSLLMSRNAKPLEDAGFSTARDAKGFPVLTVRGKEYSSCG